jgi:hypothetical protein
MVIMNVAGFYASNSMARVLVELTRYLAQYDHPRTFNKKEPCFKAISLD